jgi:hypothetical protein
VTTVDSIGSQGQYTSATIGADGLPLISYYDGSHNGALKVAHCGNLDCSSGNTLSTVDSNSGGEWSSVTIGTDGLPLISYWNLNFDLEVAHCGNLDCSSGNAISTVDKAAQDLTQATIGSDGLPLIAYYNTSNADQLRVAHCGNLDCSSSNTISIIAGSGSALDTPGSAITIGADGLPLISFYTGWLSVAHCGNLECSSGNTTHIVDSSNGLVGAYSSVTTGTDGLPLISYHDILNSSLKVAHCGDTACSSGNTLSTVDSGNGIGAWTSVTIGTDGLPLVSYWDGGNGNLKVAHCANSACSSDSTFSTVDRVGSNGDVGKYSSVTIGADGLPLISYYDAGNGALKVAHCADTFCVPYFRRR